MRISGLASGMDIDEIVQEMMRAERKKVDVVEQNKQTLEWKQEAYQTVNRLVANFILESKKAFGLTQTTVFGGLVSGGVKNLDWVKSAYVTNQVAEARAMAGAVEGNYELEVLQLASNWAVASKEPISVGNKGNLAEQFGLEGEIDFTIVTNRGEVRITKSDLSSVHISDVVNEINQADIGVKAIYDQTMDRFFLQTTQSGSGQTVKIVEEGISFMVGVDSALKLGCEEDVVYSGKDALFNWGAAEGITQENNTFILNGVQITLKETGMTRISVATNVDEVVKKVTDFVDAYNELVDKLNLLVGEKRYPDFKPLTDEQKEEMTEKQIEKWESKAKSGLLKSDRLLEKMLQTMRMGMYQVVEGVEGSFSQLTQLGITTEGYVAGSRGGKLVVDTAKLTEAVLTDVDGVLELFFKTADSHLALKSEDQLSAEEIKAKRAQSGLITRLYDNLIVEMKGVITQAGTGEDSNLYRSVSSLMLLDFVTTHGSISMIDKNIGQLEDRIDTINYYLVRKEARYWQQFTAMEKAINQMNQQSAWLAEQFGGGF